MYLSEIHTPKEEDQFIRTHVICNGISKYWIRPLDQDIRSVFDPKKNIAFRYGKVTRWVLFNENGRPCGRIAAFVNKNYKNKGDTFPVGGIGFFDCDNNQTYANMLFDTAKEWLAKEGMMAMDGPINFGERNNWWGLLVDGFHPPVYGMNYNPPYYQDLFETYGFKNFYNQICWSMPVSTEQNQLSEKFYAAHRKFVDNPDFKVNRISTKDADRFARDFSTIYNLAWAKHEGNKKITERQTLKIFNSIKPILDSDLLWFVYYKDNPIAMWLSIPDINMIVKRLNGKLNLLGKILFLIYKKRHVINRFIGINYGIIPEFQGTGVDYFMIVEAEKIFKKKRRYAEMEFQWQGDFNPKILNISKNLGAVQSRRLVTYRYLFDSKLPFERHPIIA